MILPSGRHSGTTRRTRASDLVGSESAAVKAKVSSTANSTNKGGTNNARPTSTSVHSNDDPKGTSNHRLGTCRPCARCRVKKTKCDKSRPSCSSCQKGGVEATCVYDIDEPTSAEEQGDENAFHSVVSSTTDPSTIVETTTSVASSPASVKIESEHSERKGRKPGTSARTTTMMTTSKPANGHATRSDTNSSGNTRSNSNKNKGHPSLQEGKAEPISTTTKTLNQPESPHKDPKSGAGEITSQSSTLEKHETEARHDEAVDVESIGTVSGSIMKNCIW